MKLKIKAFIYRYTGIFLAQKEQDAHIQNQEVMTQIIKWTKNPKMEMNLKDATGLAIGLWQTKHGFYRPISFLRYNKPAWFWKPIAWIIVLYKTLKFDLTVKWKNLGK